MSHSQHEQEGPTACGGLAPAVTALPDVLEKPLADHCNYRLFRLANGLECLVVHDNEAGKASAAVDIGVGSFNDEFAGMAHAIEHILPMSSKEYPIEGDFNRYILANAGFYNAVTRYTSTKFHFDIAAKAVNDEDPTDSNHSPLYKALDRFAQFLIKPLFPQSTIENELNSVDSEHKKNLQNDTWRLDQLHQSLSNPNHPYSYFDIGNANTLKTLPESRGINVRDKFIEFHAKHYSANRMKLVVLGRESLDLLQKWVIEFFSPIVKKEVPPNQWDGEPALRQLDLGWQCFAKPVKDVRELRLYFPMINEDMSNCQPSRYISHLIEQTAPGSLMYVIKAKNWADAIRASAFPVCRGTPSIFMVTIFLTEEGLKMYTEIIKLFFQYVSLLHETPPQEWIFEDLMFMSDIDFKFQKKKSAFSFAKDTSFHMQRPLDRKWLLSGYSRLQAFEPEQIKTALAAIRPSNFMMIVVSLSCPVSENMGREWWDKQEEWYGTAYRREKIPGELIAELEIAASVTPDQRLPALHLPHQNAFIPILSDLEVKKTDVLEPNLAPSLIISGDGVRLWWKKDDAFWVPRANVIVSLQTPLINASAENKVKACLFVRFIQDALHQYYHDTKSAGLRYNIGLDSRGLVLEIDGYNSKLPMFLKQVVTTMRNLDIEEKRFEIIKDRASRQWKNSELRIPYQQVEDYTDWLNVKEGDYVVEELAAKLPNITFDAVQIFQKDILAQIYTEMYVIGNVCREDAVQMMGTVESILESRILPQAEQPTIRSLTLPVGYNYIYHKDLKDTDNVNSCMETWFYVGDGGDRGVRAKTLLIEEIINEPAFDQLRTKEQLGYVIWSGIRSINTSCGFRFLIQSEMTPEYLDSRVEEFLTKFAEKLKEMTDSDLELSKQSAINRCTEKPQDLDEECSRHWDQIKSQYYDFERAQLDADQIKSFTKPEIIEFFDTHFNPSSTKRARLSVYLHARGQTEQAQSRQEEGQKKAQAQVLNGTAPSGAVIEITDVHAFKSERTVGSGARPATDLSEYEDLEAMDPKSFMAGNK